MMGIQTTQKDLFSYQVDLDRRVRQDNPLRAIREKVDFAWVRADVAHHYGNNGNESVDPEVIHCQYIQKQKSRHKSTRQRHLWYTQP